MRANIYFYPVDTGGYRWLHSLGFSKKVALSPFERGNPRTDPPRNFGRTSKLKCSERSRVKLQGWQFSRTRLPLSPQKSTNRYLQVSTHSCILYAQCNSHLILPNTNILQAHVNVAAPHETVAAQKLSPSGA